MLAARNILAFGTPLAVCFLLVAVARHWCCLELLCIRTVAANSPGLAFLRTAWCQVSWDVDGVLGCPALPCLLFGHLFPLCLGGCAVCPCSGAGGPYLPGPAASDREGQEEKFSAGSTAVPPWRISWVSSKDTQPAPGSRVSSWWSPDHSDLP